MLDGHSDVALEILDHVVNARYALALRRRCAREQLAEHVLRTILDADGHEREQVDDAQDLVLIFPRQSLDSANQPQNVFRHSHIVTSIRCERRLMFSKAPRFDLSCR